MPIIPVTRASWVLAGLALFLVLQLHLLLALLSGLLVYELVHLLAPLFSRRLSSERAKLAVVALLGTVVIGAVSVTILASGALLHTSHLPALALKMAEILENSRLLLPDALAALLPDSTDALKNALIRWLREHAAEVQGASKEGLKALAHLVIGMAIGAMAALHEAGPANLDRPLALALTERTRRFANAFSRIVFAQVKISAINTALTALYLELVLPVLGIQLPLTKTMIAVTFAVGLVPVIGNLVSNTIIVVVSLSYSPQAAIGSLAFLVLVHKLEYLLNARIIGARISAGTWELLLAMLVMEAAFGLPGLVAAPIYYAYLKDELGAAGMI